MNEAPQDGLASLDTYRCFVMFLMMAEVMRLWELARSFPESTLCQWIRFNTTQVEWPARAFSQRSAESAAMRHAGKRQMESTR